MPAKNTDMKKKIIKGALSLAMKQGWENVGLRDIANETGMTLADLHDYAEDKTDILVLLGRQIDRAVLENCKTVDEDSSPKDRLFDVLMERYEILNAYREGITAILSSMKYDPKQAVISLPHLCRSMTWMLEAAGIETNGLKGAIKVAGLTTVYVKILKTWMEDESEDLSKTMSALDKALGRAEQAANTLGF